jgi:hypothetical protein
MRFYEFATLARPVLKISQQTHPAGANTPPTPLPRNTLPTQAPAEPIKVYPRAWQHEWVQKYLAAKMARDAQTITPTEDDIAIAMLRYGEAQRAADEQYKLATGKASADKRWVKRA